jgi:hypothetical protein
MVQRWTKTLTFANFGTTFDGKVTDVNTWLVAKYKVPAQQVVRVGTGQIQNGVDDRGIFFLKCADATADVEGQFRITYMDANELSKKVVKEGYTSTVHTSKSVRDAANVLPETGPGVRQDSYVVIEFLPAEGAKTLDIDKCDLQLPVTIFTA